MTSLLVTTTLAVTLLAATPLQESIERVKRQRAAQEQAQAAAASAPVARLSDIIDPVSIRHAGSRQAFEWWSQTTGISLVIHWESLINEGVNPDAVINLELRHVPAGAVLGAIMAQASPDIPLMYEVTPWFVRIETKQQASRRLIVRMYDIADLLMEVPSFDGAPRMDLQSALEPRTAGGGTGGGGGGTSGGIFGDARETSGIPRATRQDRVDEIVRLIQDTIEPEIWDTYGGEATIRHHRGRLLINAPLYVHRQIGKPVPRRPTRSAATSAGPSHAASPTPSGPRPPASSGGDRVSGIGPREGMPRVSGVQGQP